MNEAITNLTPQKETDTETGSIRTQKTSANGHPLSACIWEVFQADPDRTFQVRDVAEITRGKVDTVNRILSRFYREGKVLKPSHGFYKFNPLYEEGNLMAFARSGVFWIENLTCVRMGARGTSGQSPKTAPDDQIRTTEPAQSGQNTGTIRTTSDTSIPTPKTGYPWYLVTGQEIFWGTYTNGTEIIRISANGKRPISIDLVLQIFENFKIHDFNIDEWQCNCFEANKDGYTRRFEGNGYTMRVIEGVLIKAYNHGDAARLEIANRQPIPLREVTDLFNYLHTGIGISVMSKSVDALDKRLRAVEKRAQYAVNVATKVRDDPNRSPYTPVKTIKTRPKEQLPKFKTGAEIKSEQVSHSTEIQTS